MKDWSKIGNVIPAEAMATAQTAERVHTTPARNTHRMDKGRRRSFTPGKSKNEWCQTDPTKKFFFCNAHSWKHAQYGLWADLSRLKVMGSKTAKGVPTSNPETKP